MKQILALLVVLFLAFPAFAGNHQNARNSLKADPAIAAGGLSNAVLDRLIDQARDHANLVEQYEKEQRAKARIQELLDGDATLKSSLMSEPVREMGND